jgi:hypothetical protein
MSPHDYLKQLGTESVPHSGRSFYDHLTRVEQVLRVCHCDEPTCLAGLFHSIYGTSHFQVRTTEDRDKVREVIGERAEYLAWLFCNAKRPDCWFSEDNFLLVDGSSIKLDNRTMSDLRMIEGANLLEQQRGMDIFKYLYGNRTR